MEDLGTKFAIGIVSGFFKLLPLLITVLLFKYAINRLLEKNDKKRKNKYQKNYSNNENYLSITEIANYFNIKPKHLNIILSELKWCYKSNKWWIATELGKIMGAKQYYNPKTKNKYIKWESSIKNDEELINKINDFRMSNNF